MNPLVYLLNGQPVFSPPGGGGNWSVNNLVVAGTLNVGGAATFSSSGSFGGNLTVSTTTSAYTDKLLRVINGVGASLVTVTGDGRTYLGADMGYNSVFTVRRTTGNAVNELANIGDADGFTLRFLSTATQYKMSLLGSTGIISFGNVGVNDQQVNINTATGNLLVGTTTDAGFKLQVSGSVLIDKASVPGLEFRESGVTKAQLYTSSGEVVLCSNTAKSVIFQTNGLNALVLDSSQNATFAGEVKAATRVYGRTDGAGLYGLSAGGIEQATTVNSTTYSVTMGSAKVFIVQLASGDAALCYTSYVSSTVTILGSNGTIVNSSSPTATQLGIYKSANSHVVSFKTGSNALAGGYGSWGFCFLGNPVTSIT